MPATTKAIVTDGAGPFRNGGGCAHEQPGTDDGADAERDERHRAQRPLERAFPAPRGIVKKTIDRLGSKQ